MDYLLDRLLGCIHDVVPFDCARVLFTEQEGSPRLFVARESPRSPARAFSMVAIDDNPFIQQIVVEKRKVFCLVISEKENTWRPIRPVRSARCWIGVPLVMHDCVLGVLSIVSRTPGLLRREHFWLAKLLAIPMAVSISLRAQLYFDEWAAIYGPSGGTFSGRAQAVPIGHVEGNKKYLHATRFELDVLQGSKFSGSIVPTSRTTDPQAPASMEKIPRK